MFAQVNAAKASRRILEREAAGGLYDRNGELVRKPSLERSREGGLGVHAGRTGSGSERIQGLRLVVEPNMSGHRFNYVRILVDFARRNAIPIALLTSPSGKDEYRAKVSGPARDVQTFVTPSATPSLTEVAEFTRIIQPHLVAFPSGDWAGLGLVSTLGWHGVGRLRILAIREFAQSGGGVWRARRKTIARKLAFALMSLQPGVRIALLASAIIQTCGFLPRLPDPIEFEPSSAVIADLQEQYGISSETYWFAVVGAIDERKNIPVVLRPSTSRQSKRGVHWVSFSRALNHRGCNPTSRAITRSRV